MTAAGDGALLAGRDVIVGVVDQRVLAAASSAVTTGVVIDGVVAANGSIDCPTHGGRKSKA